MSIIGETTKITGSIIHSTGGSRIDPHPESELLWGWGQSSLLETSSFSSTLGILP